MAFSDPISITLAGVATSLPRISTGGNASNYATSDGLLRLTISHQPGAKRTRRMMRLDQTKVSADPFIPAQNVLVRQSFWTMADVPAVGFTLTESKDLMAALVTYQSASTYAAYLKALGGES